MRHIYKYLGFLILIVFRYSFFLCSFFLCVSADLRADELDGFESNLIKGQHDLQVGMTPEEVLKILGRPHESLERESKREQVWTYKHVRLRFSEGRLNNINILGEDPSGSDLSSPKEVAVSGQTPELNAGAADGQAVEEILSQILEGSQEPKK